MKLSTPAAILISAAALVGSIAAQERTGENEKAWCYCAGATETPSQNCDPTVRVTYTAANSTEACEAYCLGECGEGAGSSFECSTEDLNPCNAGTTVCDCSCEHNATVPSPIQFASQCGAFCDREDVCDSTGFSFTCAGSSASTVGIAVGSGILAAVLAYVSM